MEEGTVTIPLETYKNMEDRIAKLEEELRRAKELPVDAKEEISKIVHRNNTFWFIVLGIVVGFFNLVKNNYG
jgi:hypothetical protein